MFIFIAISAVVLPSAAAAQTPARWYLSVGAGVNVMQQEHADVTIESAPVPELTGEVQDATGPAFIAAIGHRFGARMRVEAEGSVRSNRITGESGFGNQGDKTGTERKYGAMANVLYDAGVHGLRPYVGAGAGVQFVHEPGANAVDGPISVVVPAQTRASFAYQAMAGLTFPLSPTRGLSLTAEYRYLGLAGTRLYTGTATIQGAGTFALTDRSIDDRNHSLLIGLRWVFGS